MQANSFAVTGTKFLPLGVGVVVLIVGTAWLVRDNSNPAAAVLVGAGLAIGVEGYRFVLDERRRAQDRDETNAHWKRQDLEETRRLLYMALSVADAAEHGSADLAGSIANSLAHHSKRLTEEEARSLARAIATGDPVTDTTVTDRIKREIESISSRGITV